MWVNEERGSRFKWLLNSRLRFLKSNLYAYVNKDVSERAGGLVGNQEGGGDRRMGIKVDDRRRKDV